jgi:2-phospho-L-lactate/phosphoenolpyruvate guanylyltransferase
MSCWALVPIKGRVDCKSRLAGVLPAAARLALVRGMLRHVLETLRATPGVNHVALVSCERDVVPADFVLLPDRGRGLSACLTDAADAAVKRGAERLLIVPGDLPLVHSAELVAIIEASRLTGFALAPDRHDGGTNAMCAAAPLRVPFCFGPGSFQRHLAQAASVAVVPAVLRSPGLAFDLDDPADWRALMRHRGRAGAPARAIPEAVTNAEPTQV